MIRLRGMPVAPVEIADEVEMYARESGRHATLQFIPTLFQGDRVLRGTWLVKMTLRPDDKRLLRYQTGEDKVEPTEDVWLHEEEADGTYRAFDLTMMGAGGLRQFLEKGNTWSGRGEFRSIEEVAQEAMRRNAKMKENLKANAKEENKYRMRETRRSRYGIPFLPVGVQLESKVAGATSTTDLVSAATTQEM